MPRGSGRYSQTSEAWHCWPFFFFLFLLWCKSISHFAESCLILLMNKLFSVPTCWRLWYFPSSLMAPWDHGWLHGPKQHIWERQHCDMETQYAFWPELRIWVSQPSFLHSLWFGILISFPCLSSCASVSLYLWKWLFFPRKMWTCLWLVFWPVSEYLATFSPSWHLHSCPLCLKFALPLFPSRPK